MRSITATSLCLTLAALLTTSAGAGMGSGMGGKDDHHQNHEPRLLVAFGSMYGVDGPFVGDANKVRGVQGDELPWAVARSAKGFLTTSGHLVIAVKGLVFKDDPSVPAEIRGTNDETEFRGLVSCLTEDGSSVVESNVVTQGFPANTRGDSFINARVVLPNPCVAPIVMVLAGSEDKWFAMTGFESEGN